MNKDIDKMLLKVNIEGTLNKYDLFRLNLGCGWTDFPKEWFNVGLFLEKRIVYGEIKELEGAQVLHYDLNEELPLPDESMEYVYASHFIEHLPIQAGTELLHRINKVMKKGGLIRLTCPDMKLWIEKYYTNDETFFKKFYEISPSFPELKTKGEIFVGQLHGWGHKWLYDFESLKDIMERAGFANVQQLSHHNSKIPDIKLIEPTNDIRLMETLYVEAQKED